MKSDIILDEDSITLNSGTSEGMVGHSDITMSRYGLELNAAGPRVKLKLTSDGNVEASSPFRVYSSQNPTVLQIWSSAGFGAGSLQFYSDPVGSPNLWRPALIESTDSGNFTGGLKFCVNGTGPENKVASVEVMRLSINGVQLSTSLFVKGNVSVGNNIELNGPAETLRVGQVNIHKQGFFCNSTKRTYVVAVDGENSAMSFLHPDDGHYSISFDGKTGNAWFSGNLQVDGNVGIGTSTPSAPLHVARYMAVGPFAPTTGTGGIDVTGEMAKLGFVRRNLKAWPNPPAAGDRFMWYNPDGSARLWTEAKGDLLTVSKEGNVSILKGKLDVNGPIFQRGKSLHADYVFESDYQVESIQEHAEFMWKNKHLKSIQPVTTDESGLEVVEVGSHFRSILEELEKAHIYIDQLHKQNKALEERLAMIEEKLGKVG